MQGKALALVGGALIYSGGAAHAAITTVVGSSPAATACYRAADSEQPRAQDLSACNQALGEADLVYRDRIATLVNRGIVRFRLGQLDGAVSDFDVVLASERKQPDALINKGIALLAGGGSIDAAVALIDAGLAGTPQRPWVGYYGRAVAHELAGRDRLAYRDYRRAQELKPGWALATRALSRFSRG